MGDACVDADAISPSLPGFGALITVDPFGRPIRAFR